MKSLSIVFSLLLLGALVVSCSCNNDSKNTPLPPGKEVTPVDISYPEPDRPAKKFALLVGINDYKYPDIVTPLVGCVNDVANMKDLLITSFGFAEADIMTLTNEQATHQGILDAFTSHLINSAQRDDIIVFHYSGHGSQMKDAQGGDEPDGWDETIVPYDSRDTEGKVTDISDDKLNELLLSLSQKSKNVTYIFDSCHSGTISRATSSGRYIKADSRDLPAPAAASRSAVPEGTNDLRPANVPYVLLSACLAKQTAFEYITEAKKETMAGGKTRFALNGNGALTYFFTKAVRESGPNATYRDIMDKVAGLVQLYFPNQEPQLEGTETDKLIFNDTSRKTEPYMIANPLGSSRMRLEGGALKGVTSGSVVAVFPPGTKSFDDLAQAAARFTIDKVEGFHSEGKKISGNKIEANSRAVVAEANYPALTLRVYYEGLDASPVLKQLQQRLGSLTYIKTQPLEVGYHIRLLEKDGNIHWLASDNSILSPAIAAVADSLPRMETRMKQWARWFNTLAIANTGGQATIELDVLGGEGGSGESIFGGDLNMQVKDGTIVTCKIRNTGSKPQYIYLLIMSGDGSINVVYPFETGANERLDAGAEELVSLRLTVPAGRKTVSDVFKVFATKTPVNFHLLASESIRAADAPTDPLGQLFGQALQGSRTDHRLVDQTAWETISRIVRVERP